MNLTNRFIRHGLVALMYALLTVGSLGLSYLLRFEFTPPAEPLRQMLRAAPWFVAVKILIMLLTGQFKSLLTFFSVTDFLRIARAGALGVAVFFGVWLLSNGQLAPPRSVIVMDAVFFVGMASAWRLFLRHRREQWECFSTGVDRHLEPVAIIGAGEAGARLAQEFTRHPGFGLSPVVFLDDDSRKWGQQLHGVRVAGGPAWLLGPEAPESLRRVIIAMPSAPRKRVRAIIENLEGKGFQLGTTHSIHDLLESKTSVARLRPIQIDDLLGRDTARLNSEGIRQMIAGRVVAVTGAGGSIGSELCRQILGYQPAKLLLIERSEGLLFVIEQELIERGFKHLMTPVVADVGDRERICGIFSEHRPNILFHAAAHKHVPMMEHQPAEAIKNNTLGTARLAQAALQFGVERFVFISTDKAINPTSVMGATKRMAEMYLQAFRAAHPGKTRFVSVRFGNVLGSSGSVVPIFQRQIAAGGPVKVTHPDVTRYFMTIPEAVGLVLQSGTMGTGGEIFLLDMGRPVKILDLARQLILLQGLKPGEDIAIEFTGLRPGEKMYEELNYNSEELKLTDHSKVFRLTTTAPSFATVTARLGELENGFNQVSADDLKRLITRLVPEYTPLIKKVGVKSTVAPRLSLAREMAAMMAALCCLGIPLQGEEAATPAQSIDIPETNAFSPASWRYGDWRGFVTFTTQLRYDDNIMQTSQNVLGDFVGAAIPSCNMDYMPSAAGGAVVAHVDYAPQFVGYLSHPQYDAIDEAADGKLETTFGRSQYKAGVQYDLTTQPDLEQTGLMRVETEDANLYAGYEATAKTTVSLSPREQWSRVENGVSVWECGAALEATDHWSEKLDLTASYYGGRVEAKPGVGAFKEAVLGGVAWQAGSRSSLDLKAGFQTMDYDGGQVASGNVTPDLTLDWRWQATAKTTARLTVSYQTDFSKYVAYQVNRTFSSQVVLSHALTERVGLELRGRWVLLGQESALENAVNGGTLQYWSAGCGAIYHLNRRTDLRLDYDRQQRSGNQIYSSFDRDIVQLSVQYRF